MKTSPHVIRIFLLILNPYDSQKLSISQWGDVMHNEIEALERNQTLCITTFPLSKKAIGCKWVYKIKKRPDTSTERYKA